MKNKNSKLWKSLILLVITLALVIYILKDSWASSLEILMSSNLTWILFACLTYLSYFLLEDLCLYKLTLEYKSDFKRKESIEISTMTRFFNGITPFSSGGQPFQIYELKFNGIKLAHGTAIVMENLIIFQIALALWTAIATIINAFLHIIDLNSFLGVLLILGIIINSVLLFFFIFISSNKKASKKISRIIIKFLAKLKIVKNKEEMIENWDKNCDEYSTCTHRLIEKKKLSLTLIFYEFMALFFYYLIPFFTFKALNIPIGMNFFDLIIIMIHVYIISTFVPIPGGSGGIEYAFITLFTAYFGKSYVLSSLVIWRFVYYYLPIIIGYLVFATRKIKQNSCR